MKKIVLVLLVCCPLFGQANARVQQQSAADVGVALRGVDLLRDRIRDPDSLVIERVYAKTDHKPDQPQMCIRFRSRNGFGGYVRNMAEYEGGNSLDPNADEHFSPCAGIEQNWNRAVKKGWADITDEYLKAAVAGKDAVK